MKALSNADAFQVLLLQAADKGRGTRLFGESQVQARDLVPPFLIGGCFPDVYLEHPLAGDPFLDVTILYGDLKPGLRVASPAAEGYGEILDWYLAMREFYPEISCGFELDTREAELPTAAVHFQPRSHDELALDFCGAIGEPERGRLYVRRARGMPDGWPLSFFGLFRGRPDSPLRVCGYLDWDEHRACAADPAHLARAFDKIGFAAYDEAMLSQVSALMAAAPKTVDFQFDLYPDGSLGETFAIDIQFGIEQPAAVAETFSRGAGARVMGLLERWGAADDRWRLAADMAFARALPVELDGGGYGRFALTLMPQWAKARWVAGALQPSKLYHLAHAGLL